MTSAWPPHKQFFKILPVGSLFITAEMSTSYSPYFIWVCTSVGKALTLKLHIPYTSHLPGYLEKVKNLYRGSTLSNCPMPCSTYRTTTKLISRRPIRNERFGRILLAFSEKVPMTITELETPSVSELLSAIGGSIGLWLGLGVFQAIEILSKALMALADKV